jgi:hypothetical protein
MTRVEIPGYKGRYFLDEQDQVWSYWEKRKFGGPAWLILKGRSGLFSFLTLEGEKLTKHLYNLEALKVAVKTGQPPVEIVQVPKLDRLAEIERKLDQVLTLLQRKA